MVEIPFGFFGDMNIRHRKKVAPNCFGTTRLNAFGSRWWVKIFKSFKDRGAPYAPTHKNEGFGGNLDVRVGSRHFPLVIPALSRNPVDARLRGERVLSAQGLGLAGFRLKAGMTEAGACSHPAGAPVR
ncbi:MULTISPECIES: hypothetical protein [Agrobacterium]|uniref:Uncharacterized protein n=1 Tax=Agrobacterium tomkonis CFBP 6623 TaxID=1183432 RepID=A0A1S7PT30_9HYPH|nr:MULTISPECIES: hypothetical protein [Agrobacterium]MCD4660843.1 hypothetical protein [Agrobacterium sp.]CUX25834.1 hypothetical protein AGR3A_Cc300011 [Agrobacterium tomkonis CFBP 6623]